MRFVIATGLAVFLTPAAGAALGADSAASGTAAGSTGGPATLSADLDSADRIELSGPVLSASGLGVAIGHLFVGFEQGRTAELRDGLGHLGTVVEGKGTASYRSAGRFDRYLLEFNLRELTRLKPRDGAVSMRIDRAVILRTGPGGGQTSARGEGGEAPGGARSELAGALSEAIATSRTIRGWNFPIRRVAARRNGTSPAAFTLLEGAKGRLLHVHDAPAGIETLQLVTGGGIGGLHLDTVSRQAIVTGADGAAGGPASASAPGPSSTGWQLDKLALEVTLDRPPKLDVAARMRLLPPAGGGGVALLRLDETREVGKAIDWGLGSEMTIRPAGGSEAPRIAVRSLTDAAGRPVDHVHRYGTLAVDLAGRSGPAMDLRARLDTDLARLPGGHEFFTLREPGWFPVPVGQDRRYALGWKIRSAAPFRPILPGEVAGSGGDGARFELSGQLPLPVGAPILVVGKYVPTPAPTAAGAGVTVWTYARAGPQAETIARFCAAALDFFSGRFGPYPFARLEIVESPRDTGGQSGPGVVLVAGMSPAELARKRSVTGSAGFNMEFAHEVAHQWWGQKVGWTARDAWLGEALAEYSAWLFVREVKEGFGPGIVEDWKTMAGRSAGIAPIAVADGLVGDAGRRHRANLMYAKGSLFLRALADEVGEDGLIAALRGFAARHEGRQASSADLLALLEEETNRPLGPIFEEWIERAGLPAPRRAAPSGS